MADTHECPARGCGRRVPSHMLMCRADWYRLPVLARRAVWNAWQGGRGAGTQAHTAAITAAISVVNESKGC